MSRLEKAFERLTRALDALEEKVDQRAAAPGPGPDLKAERDALAAKVHKLQARSEEEAQLRGEAAEAVRAALSDLRAMAAQGGMYG